MEEACCELMLMLISGADSPSSSWCCSAPLGGRGPDHLKRRGGQSAKQLTNRTGRPHHRTHTKNASSYFPNKTWPVNGGVLQDSRHRHSRILPRVGECVWASASGAHPLELPALPLCQPLFSKMSADLLMQCRNGGLKANVRMELLLLTVKETPFIAEPPGFNPSFVFTDAPRRCSQPV